MYKLALPGEEEKKRYGFNVSPQNIPLLSFFAGAGFLDIGFMQAGFDIIWRNEYNPFFVKGFEYAMAQIPHLNSNGNGKVHNTHSITDLTVSRIAREAFHNLPTPEIFGIIGGPPCPDFAKGGKNRGREGDHGKLSQIYINTIIELKPTFFLFENVPGLLRTKKHRQFLYELLSQLAEYYYLDLNVLNALEYGVPQDRERLFIIGFLKKWAEQSRDMHLLTKWHNQEAGLLSHKDLRDYEVSGKEHWFTWPVRRYEQAKIRYAWPEQSPFGAEPEKPMGIPDELMIGSIFSAKDEITTLPNGLEAFEPRSSKFTTIEEGDVSRKSFKRLHRWRYSPAAAYGNNEVHLHPTLPRRLTVREALRIQTVPDTYAFPQELPLSHKFKMIGNGVPVKLAYALATSFASFLIPHS
jgi:DNA (cytosine-5)-methyltransferase 1